MIRAILLTLFTVFIAWLAMLLASFFLYGGEGPGHWILFPMMLGRVELMTAPVVIALVLGLRYTKANTTSGLVFGHAFLMLVFVLLGAGILGNDNDLGELSWLPIGTHAVLLASIAWMGAPIGDRA